MSELITNLLIGFSAFAAGTFCGASLVGPKVYTVIAGTLSQMSQDLNPRRDSEAT